MDAQSHRGTTGWYRRLLGIYCDWVSLSLPLILSGSKLFFTCRLTIANQMLSLVGSLQEDPFSPDHVPGRPILATSEPQIVVNEPLDPGLDDEHVQLILDEDSDEDVRDAKPPLEPEVVKPKKSEKKEKKRKREVCGEIFPCIAACFLNSCSLDSKKKSCCARSWSKRD